jgi:hypothetical protein
MFTLIASQEVNSQFYIIEDPDVAEELGLDFPSFVILKSYDTLQLVYEGNLLDVNQIQTFIVEKSIKKVINLDHADNTPLFTYEIPYMILFIDKDVKSQQKLRELYTQIGDRLGDKIKFAVADMTNNYQTTIAEVCGVSESFPQIIIFQSKGKSYDRYANNQSFKNISLASIDCLYVYSFLP